MELQLSLPRINIIGAGIVGKVLGKLAVKKNLGTIQSVLNTEYKNAKRSVAFIGEGQPINKISDLEPADLYFITTPDSLIEQKCCEIAELNLFKPNAIVIHCSGIVKLNALDSAKEKHCQIARVHPIYHMYNAEQAFNHFKSIYCIYEGDDACYDFVQHFFTTINGIVLRMQKQEGYIYHAAGVLAASYHQILIAAAASLYEDCGIEKSQALGLSIDLAKIAINNTNKSMGESLVEGPIKRSDLITIEKNRMSLRKIPLIGDIYDALGKYAVSISSHDEKTKEALEMVLVKDSDD